MAVFKIDVEKRNGSGGIPFWTNVYHIEAPNVFDAGTSAQFVIDAEKEFHSQDVYFTKALVSTVEPDDNVFVTLPINASGVRTRNGDGMPIFLAMRVDLSANVGRGGRKFYHLQAGEADQAGGEWGVGLVADVVSALDDMLVALNGASTPLVSPSGLTTYFNLTAYLAITQHQFTRASRRNTGILP